jgi:citryl-CoA lyase
MDFDHRLGKGFFLLGRTAGLVAQVYEEISRERPMRRMFVTEHDYDGPNERDIPDDYGEEY